MLVGNDHGDLVLAALLIPADELLVGVFLADRIGEDSHVDIHGVRREELCVIESLTANDRHLDIRIELLEL